LPLTGVLPDAAARSKAVIEIERLVQRPNSDREKLARVASEAVRLFDELGRLLATAKHSTPTDNLLDRLQEAAPRVTGSNWDGEAQLYLALVALHYAKHDSQGGPPSDDPLTSSLRQTREELMFPTLVEGGRSRRFDSPRGLDTQATLRERLLPEIERLLRE
jgi:hypothetical protein